MKKTISALAALLLAVLLALTASGLALPDPSRAETTASGDGGVVYAAENGPFSSRVYGLDGGGRMVFFYREANGGGQSAITRLAWDKDRLCLLRETPAGGDVRWEVLALDEDARAESLGVMTARGYRATGLTGPACVAAVAADGSGSAAVFDVSTGASVLRQSAPAEGRLLWAAYLPEEGALLAALDADGSAVKVGRTGVYPTQAPAAPELPGRMSVPLSLRLLCAGPLLLAAAAAVLLLETLGALVVLLCLRGRRLAVRAGALSALAVLVGLLLMAGLLLSRTTAERLDERLDQTGRTARRLCAALSVQDPACVLRGDFHGSREQDLYAGLLSAGGESDLLALREGALSVAVSARRPYAQPAQYAYDPAVAQLAAEAAQSGPAGRALWLNGAWTAVYAAPLYSSGVPVGVVVTAAGGADIFSAALATLAQLALAGALVSAAACAALALLLCRLTRPIGAIRLQMEAVSDGDLKVRDIRAGLDELGEMARTMQEMCMGLSIRQYEVQSTIDSYNRFVPRGLCTLLDRASVMEVSFGDVQDITGNMCLLAVNNREEARRGLEDGPFVAFVNSAFSAVDRNARAHGGYLLTSGDHLGAMKLYYPGKAASAVCAGLDLLGETRTAEAGRIAPEFFLLLHHARFLYGIAGTQDEVFPFLSSQEMEFLGSYASRFAETGAQVVATDAFLRRLEPGYVTRYIGYVSAPDTGESYKLYEILDAYPELERNLRIRYDARFQEAIQLFYKSDYYLARNLFSTLLRACPGDGIARWYLFACEHCFNAGAQGEPDCRLFGIEA